MYLLFDSDTQKNPLADFKCIGNDLLFIFKETMTDEILKNVSIFKMYSDDDMLLAEYIAEQYTLVCEGKSFYLNDKNKKIDLDILKYDKINKSKQILADWLQNNPILYTDGNYYSVTEEKQALLNGNLASYERAKSTGIEYPLKWNSTGAECELWNYNDLVALSLTIAGYVAPKVAMQQAYELQIKACESVDEINEIVISYD